MLCSYLASLIIFYALPQEFWNPALAGGGCPNLLLISYLGWEKVRTGGISADLPRCFMGWIPVANRTSGDAQGRGLLFLANVPTNVPEARSLGWGQAHTGCVCWCVCFTPLLKHFITNRFHSSLATRDTVSTLEDFPIRAFPASCFLCCRLQFSWIFCSLKQSLSKLGML